MGLTPPWNFRKRFDVSRFIEGIRQALLPGGWLDCFQFRVNPSLLDQPRLQARSCSIEGSPAHGIGGLCFKDPGKDYFERSDVEQFPSN